ncbi:MAG: SGNH/GDSL hydrolase family protein, partial [Phycisphaerae bacterium]|nr:SGNH/GDSL hydrolase family protein [Phycisphaerae bacterium]
KLLAGVANVHRPPENCASTIEGQARVDRWLGEKKWDVIHFNWGLHDLKYLGPNGENLADPAKSTSRQKVPIDAYRKRLTSLVQRLRRTGATLIWRSTTPVPEGVRGRVPGDAVRYNRVALEVMKSSKVEVQDLWAWSKPRLGEIQLKANVHFSREGSEKLAREVAARIKQALASRDGAVDAARR